MFFRQIPCSSPLPGRLRNHFHDVGKAKKNQDREQRDQKVGHHCVLLGRAAEAPASAVDILDEVSQVNSSGDEIGAARHMARSSFSPRLSISVTSVRST